MTTPALQPRTLPPCAPGWPSSACRINPLLPARMNPSQRLGHHARRRGYALAYCRYQGLRSWSKKGEIRQELFGQTLHIRPGYDKARMPDIKKWFESYYTIRFAYPVDESYLDHGSKITD